MQWQYRWKIRADNARQLHREDRENANMRKVFVTSLSSKKQLTPECTSLNWRLWGGLYYFHQTLTAASFYRLAPKRQNTCLLWVKQEVKRFYQKTLITNMLTCNSFSAWCRSNKIFPMNTFMQLPNKLHEWLLSAKSTTALSRSFDSMSSKTIIILEFRISHSNCHSNQHCL